MRISVVIPEPLEREMERYKRQHGATTSSVVREALEHYLVDERRRAAGEALTRAAAKHARRSADGRQALQALNEERERSDRS